MRSDLPRGQALKPISNNALWSNKFRFNQSGKVIGITQAALDPQLATESISALPKNVNYAIKSKHIKKLLPILPE